MEVASSDPRGDESSLTLPVASLSADGIAVVVSTESGNDVAIVDDNDNSDIVRNMAAEKEEEFAPDTPTSCSSINTIQVVFSDGWRDFTTYLSRWQE